MHGKREGVCRFLRRNLSGPRFRGRDDAKGAAARRAAAADIANAHEPPAEGRATRAVLVWRSYIVETRIHLASKIYVFCQPSRLNPDDGAKSKALRRLSPQVRARLANSAGRRLLLRSCDSLVCAPHRSCLPGSSTEPGTVCRSRLLTCSKLYIAFVLPTLRSRWTPTGFRKSCGRSRGTPSPG